MTIKVGSYRKRLGFGQSVRTLLIGPALQLAIGVTFAAEPLPEGADAPLAAPVIYPVPAATPSTPPIPTTAHVEASGIPSASSMQFQTALSNPGGLPTEAGKSPTSFAVSNDGAATYTIPLWTAPGVGAVQPKLALVYNSHAPDGIYGVGWNLSGLSAISRCNKTYAQDGNSGGVTLTMSDRYCLDGQQLKLTSASGTYGQPNSTYATEIESFSKVQAGTTSVGNGPASFTVTTKNGLIYEYGTNNTTTHSEITLGGTIHTWALSKIRDRVGNYIQFVYTFDSTNGNYIISEIDYPYTATGQGPFYRVQFAYSPRPSNDNIIAYVAGNKTKQVNAISSLTMQWKNGIGLWTTTKSYTLTLTQNTAVSGRMQLTSVQECSTSSCLPPTTISYQNGQIGIANPTTSSGASSVSVVRTADVDGDGKMDLVYSTVSGSNAHWYVKFATTSGFGSPVDTTLVVPSGRVLLLDDFRGEGKSSLLTPVGTTWYEYRWNGGAFVGTNTGVTVPNGGLVLNTSCSTADVDGDGRPDLACIHADTSSVYLRLNTTPAGGAVNFGPETQVLIPGYLAYNLFGNNQAMSDRMVSNVRSMDFNGDGHQDMAVLVQPSGGGNLQWLLLLSTGTGSGLYPAPLSTFSSDFMPINFNNDACTDLVIGNTLITWACSGVQGGSFTFSGSTPIIATDWNSDGRVDLLVNSGGTLQAWLSQGDILSSGFLTTGINANSGSGAYQLLDIDGDGLDDLIYASYSAGTVTYGVHQRAQTPPDLAISFTDGFGMNQSPTYVAITQSSNYQKYTDAVFPEADYQGPLYVVNQFTASDGTGSTYQNQLFYYGARVHFQGRGFEGFYAKRTFDSRNSLYTFDYSQRTFPYTGMFYQEGVLPSFSAPYIRLWSGTPANQITGGTGYEQRYFPYLSPIVDQQYEYQSLLADGTQTSQTATTYAYGDTYGNPTQVQTSITDLDPSSPFHGQVWQTTTTTAFLNDTTAWCLGLPSGNTTVQSVVPGQTTQTRTFSYTPDTNHNLCREQSQVIEPSTTALMVTTALGYDSCGNVNSIGVTGHTATGSAMTTRTTGLGYGTRCQLPETITNALSQSTGVAYQYDFGVPTQTTDPNGISVNQTYDDYGRLATQTNADNTSIARTYNACNSGNNYCGVPDLRFWTDDNYYDSNHAFVNEVQNFLDGFSRERDYEPHRVFGVWTRAGVMTYDSLGRMHAHYNPSGTTANGYDLYQYDGKDRLTRKQLYRGDGTLDRTTSYAYGGQTTTITDPLNNVTTQINDVVGLLRQVTDPSPGGTTSYDFDVFRNLNKITDAIGKVSQATYNLRGFKTQMIDADQGTWNFSGDSLNELTGWTDAKSQSFGAAYDALGRMISRSEPDLYTQWTWGALTHNDSTHKYIGTLKSVCTGTGTNPANCPTNPGYSESRTNDAIARLADRAITIPGDAIYNYDYAYNALGAIDTITYPTSPAPTGTTATRFKIQYGYSYGFPYEILDITQPTATLLWLLNAANDYSSSTSETLGVNLVSVASGYKLWTNELTSLQSGVSGSTTNRQNLAYQWDVNGNLIQRQDVNQSLTEVFYPDPLNRLDHSTLKGVTNLSMGYDAAGDITSKTSATNPNENIGSYAYGNASHPHAVTAAGSNTYTWDANGNAQTKNGLTFTWASYNLPTQLQATVSGTTLTSSFFYGSDHQRYKQVGTYLNGTETTTYVGDLLQKKYTTSTGLTYYRHYVRTPSGRTVLVSRNSGGSSSTSYLLTDHLGSSDAVLDGSGALKVQESFGAFGQRRAGNTWTGSPSSGDAAAIAATMRDGLTGHETLDNLNLIHMNGRVYDPVTGRFLSADPYVSHPGFSQSYNRYSYVNNSPLRYVDPSGFAIAGCLDVEGECEGLEAATSAPGDMQEVVISGGPNAPKTGSDPGITVTVGDPGGGLQTVTVVGTPTKSNKPPTTQGNPLPCSAANSTGQGVLIQMGFTDAHSSGAAIPDANHIVVLAVDPTTGAVYASRGGPGSGAGGGAGSGPFRFVANSGAFAQGFPDYGSLTGVQTVGYVNASFAQVTGYFNSFATTTNANNLTYLGPVQNSNSYASALVAGLGFPSATPDVKAPGYGTNSPSSQLQCTKP